MKLFNLSLLCALTISSLSFADATDDLLYAIENGDVHKVVKALENGADCDEIRTQDNHNARSLAIAKLLETAESQKITYVAGIATLSLPALALWNNPKYAAASLTGWVAGLLIAKNNKKGLVEKAQHIYLDKALLLGSTLATAATAWSAPQTWARIVSAIGTAGLLTVMYKAKDLKNRFDIYSMINPEDRMTEEQAQD